MNLVIFLLRSSWKALVAALIAGGLSGAGSALLIASLNEAIDNSDKASQLLLWGFIGLALITLVSGIISQILLARLSQQAIFKMRLQLSHRILACPLRRLEELGENRILATLTDDIEAISNTLFSLPLLFVNLALVIGCMAYLALISKFIFLMILVVIVVAIIIIQLMLNYVHKLIRLARDRQDLLLRYFRSIIQGVKELKLHTPRRMEFLEKDFEATAADCRDYEIRAESIVAVTLNTSNLMFFGVMGFLVFVLPLYTSVTTIILSSYVLTITYLSRPIEGIISMLPAISRGSVALKKIEELGLSIAEKPEYPNVMRSSQSLLEDRIEMVQVTHIYWTEKDEQFTLGPIDLSFSPGELIFIIGGNGSGKSTLAKLIVGLYEPNSGKILWDGNNVSATQRDAYRQLFSAVFADFYLFETLFGISTETLDDKVHGFLEQLQLDRKVKVSDGKLSTLDLSQGQRKRLALLTAYLEDRPVYLFDEWSSDQDPFFREIFYNQILFELKQRGKTVIVISHDERYFHLADKLIELDYGQRIS
ncbi:cyclic peptide transporter [Rubidibacter lacunae KORDI 51-2]|uniref:Cyclic peptide transporter n=1 Tax=Rubidibacter lacunae KORDI 51-2 TaxID=582515 RepID=U5DJG5_9CHRO|nr:cyclic peptide export ABC transporter [Rubidibacter lacunae]ERN39830.1 cyclic peptide transporter [Rubidibacter lacunae KORDI 51-2]